MKKGLIIILVVIALIVVIGACIWIGYYIWDNSESTIRSRIEKSYYAEMSHEGCELNNFVTFPSKFDCFNAIECVSREISQMIRDEELKEFNREIKAKRSIEVMVSESLGATFINAGDIMVKCMIPNGYNETLR